MALFARRSLQRPLDELKNVLSALWRLLSDRRPIAWANRRRERGLSYLPANAGEYVSGRLAGIASGRFAMIDNGLGFQLVPWQPLLEKRIGQHISGLERDDGGIEWTFGRNRGLGL